MTARAALLTALIPGKGYGLELIDRVSDRSKGQIQLNQGSIYPALKSLEKEGLLKSWEADPTPERGGRPRRYYELTADGLRAAREQSQGMLGFLRFALEGA